MCGLVMVLPAVTAMAASAEKKPDASGVVQGIVIRPRIAQPPEQTRGGGPDAPLIVPARSVESQATKPAAKEPNAETDAPEAPGQETPDFDPRRYREIYESIPFNRTEYEANPSYRHEATIELLLGEPRPKVVLRGPRWIGPAGPAFNHVSPYEALSPYIRVGRYGPFQVYDFSRGPYSRYQGLFGYRGGYRSMYYLGGGYSRLYSY